VLKHSGFHGRFELPIRLDRGSVLGQLLVDGHAHGLRPAGLPRGPGRRAWSPGQPAHAELIGLRASYHHQVSNLTTRARVRVALTLIADDDSVRAVLCRRRLERILAIDAEIAQLKRQIAELVTAAGTTLTDLHGIGPLVAARFIAEVVDVRRYPNRNAFAAANGTAPLPASSGRTVRHRFNPGGKRQLNRTLYTIATTQIRGDTEGRAYYERKNEPPANQTRSPAPPEAETVRHRVHHHAPRRRSSLTPTTTEPSSSWSLPTYPPRSCCAGPRSHQSPHRTRTAPRRHRQRLSS
jgi:transposase